MSATYSTYILGDAAVMWPEFTPADAVELGYVCRRMVWVSNWRVLHIDGFEGRLIYPMPVHCTIKMDSMIPGSYWNATGDYVCAAPPLFGGHQ